MHSLLLCVLLLVAWCALTSTSKAFNSVASSSISGGSLPSGSINRKINDPQGSSAGKRTINGNNKDKIPTNNANIAGNKAQSSSAGTTVTASSDAKTLAKEREALYEAYNLLHTLAQDFHKPFDAPAVIVVGHQTSGKSALIEALMGFQFNQVGGGTKTRRPIALRMQYNPNCITPLCFLTLENGKEEQRSLADIQVSKLFNLHYNHSLNRELSFRFRLISKLKTSD